MCGTVLQDIQYAGRLARTTPTRISIVLHHISPAKTFDISIVKVVALSYSTF